MLASRKILWPLVALAGAAWSAGCQRGTPTSEPAPVPKASQAAPQQNVASAINLPGVFVAKGIRLELSANGRYRMRTHAESANADLDSEGGWSLFGGELRLDPEGSSEPDRTYMAWTNDAFESNDGSYSLLRESPLAGSFAGTLPCADCPGIDVTLILKQDRTYRRHDAYRERNTGSDSQGLWSLQEAGSKLLLASKAQGDSPTWLAVDSYDALTLLDGDGHRIDNGMNFTLKRTR